MFGLHSLGHLFEFSTNRAAGCPQRLPTDISWWWLSTSPSCHSTLTPPLLHSHHRTSSIDPLRTRNSRNNSSRNSRLAQLSHTRHHARTLETLAIAHAPVPRPDHAYHDQLTQLTQLTQLSTYNNGRSTAAPAMPCSWPPGTSSSDSTDDASPLHSDAPTDGVARRQ